MSLAVRPLEFVRGGTPAEHDHLVTNRLSLVDGGPTYRVTMRWMPVQASWILDMNTTSGRAIVSGAWVRDRVDCLLGISSTDRPPGAIMSYDPKRRGDPTLDSYFKDGVSLLYVPGGLNPDDFSFYSVPVA